MDFCDVDVLRAGVSDMKNIADNCKTVPRYAKLCGASGAKIQSGVKYLTLYAFSTENWQRPEDEVSAIMALLIIAHFPPLFKSNIYTSSWPLVKGVKAEDALAEPMREQLLMIHSSRTLVLLGLASPDAALPSTYTQQALSPSVESE